MPDVPSDTDLQSEVIYHQPGYSGFEREAPAPPRIEPTTDKKTAGAVTGGSSLEIVAGAGAVVLSIIALAGYAQNALVSVASIAIGGALLLYAAAVTSRWGQARSRLAGTRERTELIGGMTIEMLGGAVGVLFGILSLAGAAPRALLPISAIVLGGSMLLAAPAQQDVARFGGDADPKRTHATYEAVQATSGAMALVGCGAIVLGIIGLVSAETFVLTAVAMLAMGGALMFSGGALAARFASGLRHAT